MKLSHIASCGAAVTFLVGAGLHAEDAKPVNPGITSPPVYVPNTSRTSERLANGLLAWDSELKETNAPADITETQFVFNFTNVSPDNIVVMNVRTSCGCTTVQLPPTPWTLSPGTNGQIGVKVNFAGKTGTLFKTVTVTTDKGFKQLMVKVTILPPATMQKQSEADRAKALELAKADRQAVFQGDCAKCHLQPGEGKFGKALFDADCGICHEAEHRATMVPDLRAIKGPTNFAFWQMWISYGKPGSLMPAFATAQGGPLNDMQINSLARYLAETIPSQVPLPPPAGK